MKAPLQNIVIDMKKFNTTGKCIADRHYMVPIDRQVEYAAQMVEDNLYLSLIHI